MSGRNLAAVFALLFLTSAAARAQQPQPTPESKPESKPEAVRLNVTFTDDKGRPASDVRREDVRVLVGGVEQPVSLFERQSLPASYGLVVDNSGSMRSQMNYVIEAARVIVNANAQGDETFLVRFVGRKQIALMVGFTSNKEAIGRGLDEMYVEGGQTALIDALYFAAEHMQKNAVADAATPRQRALVLISDGEDRDSAHKPEQLFALLKSADIRVFSIALTGALNDEGGFTHPSARDAAVSLVKRLAEETGGLVFTAKKVGELQQAVEQVANALHARYVLGYDPPAGAKPGAKVEIKVVEKKGSPKLKAVVQGGR